MISSVIIWGILVLIGVFDAREHRIPNLLLLSIIIIHLIFLKMELQVSIPLSGMLMGLLGCFFIGCSLYVSRVMAAGDVKLLMAIGFILGYDNIVEFAKYACLALIIIGIMYSLLNHLFRKHHPSNIQIQLNAQPVWFFTNKTTPQSLAITYMPFAPVLVIGLAMYQYASY